MSGMMHKNRSVNTHEFAMVPKAEIPRSSFDRQFTHKTTFDAGYLVPVYLDEVLPGDSFSLKMTAFARLATPIYPIMDNLYMDSFFFFVPNRLVWTNWVKFMGEQDNPADSISYSIPAVASITGGFAAGTLQTYFGLPIAGQVTGTDGWSYNNLPFRAYNLIWNQWFRDENLQNSVVVDKGDGPDAYTNYSLLRRGKRHDYFTSALPWPQKGGVAVQVPLGTSAPIRTSSTNLISGAQTPMKFLDAAAGGTMLATALGTQLTTGNLFYGTTPALSGTTGQAYPSNLYADLSTATSATINQLRQAFQIQKLLERDARGGTRYTEIIRSHFGVLSPDARLQRPEYLGGGTSPINISPIAQTSGTGVTGGTTPLATLAAVGTTLTPGHGFSASFTEHGYIIGMVCVRADLTYQQGLRRLWTRATRYDFYFPVFAMLGEQTLYNEEIFKTGTNAIDKAPFGYQERWAEYRYLPSMITGQFNSNYTTPLDAWHLAQKFATLPTLGATFIQENPPISRVVAVGAASTGQQFIFDSFFSVRSARLMPLYSVPGLIDHF